MTTARAPVGETGVILEVNDAGEYRLGFPESLETEAPESWIAPAADLFSYELMLRPDWCVSVGFSDARVDVSVAGAGGAWTVGAVVQIGNVWACPRPVGEVTLRITNGDQTVFEHRPVRDRTNRR